MEITYFASCCLMPRDGRRRAPAAAKREKDLAIEDFRDAFGVTHEAAAQRFTSLATHHLGIPVHFLRIGGDGAIYRAYANDGLPLPTDVTGAIEGQLVCRSWGVRRALARRDRTTESYQYTDTPAGTFWCSTQTGLRHRRAAGDHRRRAVRAATWFRGRDTTVRHQSTCPDEACCRRPAAARPPLAGRVVAQRADPPAGVRRAAHGARSPGWTTARCTRSSTGTRRRRPAQPRTGRAVTRCFGVSDDGAVHPRLRPVSPVNERS